MGLSAGPTAVGSRGIAGAPLSYYAASAGESGINSISPSVIGSYGSQAALQGLGVYQASQLGSDSAAAAARIGGYPSYLRH
ncbi:hypothetical protein QJS04_geneDACA015094 [Acorus gramineus]|uniref:Uncharacterized protein n=1 Tax=Acorus gramineus TaxID=55184 RepID=A0AAV9BUT5_ACOGR|nr:hypothetical protein QJS04_geneDACA015094 [Acorus gramineus]